jgi:hypothetical protein
MSQRQSLALPLALLFNERWNPLHLEATLFVAFFEDVKLGVRPPRRSAEGLEKRDELARLQCNLIVKQSSRHPRPLATA